ncbi:MAG: GNAT family N-acetyltransferase [Eudoraea sp.]|nr:GNAT family N-acetyltransferase [Eudoraea sp.]
MNSAKYRAIQAEDNPHLTRIITSIFEDMQVPNEGTAYEDSTIFDLFSSFAKPRSFYFVLEENNLVLGGAGIAPLAGASDDVCELQKMYLDPLVLGQGHGTKLLGHCLKKAIELGYKKCYLETMSNMKTAQSLYLKNGFTYAKERMGSTGHYACPIWMVKNL